MFIQLCAILTFSFHTENKFQDSIPDFHNQIRHDIELRLNYQPPETWYPDSAFYYEQLISVDIDEHAEISSLRVSDNSPAWLKSNFEKYASDFMNRKDRFDSIAKVSNIKNSVFIFSVIIKSEKNKRGSQSVTESDGGFYNHYSFNGRYITGKVIFLKPLVIENTGNSIICNPPSKMDTLKISSKPAGIRNSL